MHKKIIRLTSVLLISSMLSGCATQQAGGSASSSCKVLGPKASVGILAGAALGAGAGAAVGNSNNKGAAVLVGALAGAIMGGIAGSSMDKQDCEKAQLALQKMGKAKVGKAIVWSNPSTGNHGTLVPTTKPKMTAQGLCREYKRTTYLKNGQQTGGDTGLTCRTDDGDWEVVS